MAEPDRAAGAAGAGRLGEEVSFAEVTIDNPGWVRRQVDWTRLYAGDRDRMRVALLVARQNVERKTGGPFGAAVFEAGTGRLVAVGANQARVRGGSPLLHAEVVALLTAGQRLGAERFDQLAVGLELHTSCEPCLMCAGALLMSGVSRVVSAACASDAEVVGIEAGGAPEDVWEMLERHGIRHSPGVLRDEAREILAAWRASVGRPT